MGSAFREWIKKKPLGILPVKIDKFIKVCKNKKMGAYEYHKKLK